MDLTLPVVYRGLTMTGAIGGPGGDNPVDGIRLTKANMQDVPAIGYTEKTALADGLDASDVYLGGRNIILTGEVYGATKDALFDRLDQMRAVFTAPLAYAENPAEFGYLPLDFSQPTSGGVSDRHINVRPLTQSEYDYSFVAQGPLPGRGYVIPFTVTLQAKDPTFYAGHNFKEMLVGDEGTLEVENKGTVPAKLELVLYSAEDGEFELTGNGATTRIALSAGVTLYVQDRILKDGDGRPRMDLMLDGPWPLIHPGQSSWLWSSISPLADPSYFRFIDVWV